MKSVRSIHPASRLLLLLALAILPASCALAAEGEIIQAKPPQPFPEAKTYWKEFDRHDLLLSGRKVLVVAPHEVAVGRPWTLLDSGDPHNVDEALLEKGFHFVSMDLSDAFGGPGALANWDTLYKEMVAKYGLSKKVVLQSYGAGGLLVHNWAAENPGKVACIHSDSPPLDIKSWPAGSQKSPGDPEKWKELQAAYGFKSEKEALAYKNNPVDRSVPLAKANLPILHVVVEGNKTVPLDENTFVLLGRYERAGGKRFSLILKDRKDNSIGVKDPTAIVYFILKHTLGLETGSSKLKNWKPTEFSNPGRVFQRDGVVFMEQGHDMSGANWTGPVLRENYEITLEAMRVEGGDFFCALTFPVGKNYCSLVVGGWGGTIVGISCVDFYDASDNETTNFLNLVSGQWYDIRVRVANDKIEAYIDDEWIVDLRTDGSNLSVRSEVEESIPVGIATWRTTGAFRNFDMRTISE